MPLSNFTNALDRWIQGSNLVAPRGLGLYRVAFALGMLLLFTPPAGFTPALSALPPALFRPPLGPMILFDRFPLHFELDAIVFALAASLVLLVLGWHTRLASVSTALFILLAEGFRNSTGKIDHDALLILLPAVMACSDWGDSCSFDAILARRSGRKPAAAGSSAWVGPFIAVSIGLAFATAGWIKLESGWLRPSTHATFYFASANQLRGSGGHAAPFLVRHVSSVVWEVADYLTVAFELGFALAALSRRGWRCFIAAAAVFHLINWLTLNIVFADLLLLYALFLPWDSISDRIAHLADWRRLALPSPSPVLLHAAAVLLAPALGLAIAHWGSPSNIGTVFDNGDGARWLLVAGGLCGAAYLVRTSLRGPWRALSALRSRPREAAA